MNVGVIFALLTGSGGAFAELKFVVEDLIIIGFT